MPEPCLPGASCGSQGGRSRSIRKAVTVIEGQPAGGGEPTAIVDTVFVTDGYFETVRQPVTAGRSFFSGFGAQTGFFWREYLQQVANVPLEPDARANVISSAITTFALFETWLAGWETWQHEQR